MNNLSSFQSENMATVMASVASGFAQYADASGLDKEDLFDRAGLSLDVLLDPNQSIRLKTFLDILDSAAMTSGDENFGLSLGADFKPEYLGLIGYIALSSKTVGDAIYSIVQYFTSFQNHSSLKIKPYKGLLSLEYQLWDPSIVSRRHDAELTMCLLTNVVRRAYENQWAPVAVHFAHDKPDTSYLHSRVFHSDIEFNRDSHGIILRVSDLDKPMPGYDPNLNSILVKTLSLLRENDECPAETMVNKVSSIILTMFTKGYPTLSDVADQIGVPKWTLSRQLKEEGVSFSLLVEKTRRELACHYLTKTSMNISRISELLGYNETSSFTHAFTRWFGVSPKKWRENM